MGVIMHSNYKQGVAFLALGFWACLSPAYAAKPAENPMAAKLQAMVRQLTSERDALKAENTKLAAQNEQIQTQLTEVKQSAESAVSAGSKLQGDLSAAKSSNERLQGQFDTTRSKLHELMDVSKKLNQSKNQLTEQLATLQQKQTFTAGELEVCGNKNIELLKTTKDIVANFNSRGFMSTLLGKEPVVGFNEVELENQIQDYQDKLIAQRYLKKAEAEAMPESREKSPEANEDEHKQ